MVPLPQVKVTIVNEPMGPSLSLQLTKSAKRDFLFVDEDTKMAEKYVKVQSRRKNGFPPE